MKKLPDAMIIVDPKKEYNAIREAHRLGIPVFGIVDTNCDPDDVDYPIPGNDDAVRAIKVVLGSLSNAIAEATGKEMVDYVTEEDKANEGKPVQKMESLEDKIEVVKEEKEEKKETKKEEKEEKVSEEKTVEKKTETKKETKKVAKEETKKEEKKETKKAAKEDLDSKTVAELKEMAKAKGIEGYSKLKKSELIEVLNK